jgi:N-hydroxyarylamine O-acetyltransferase
MLQNSGYFDKEAYLDRLDLPTEVAVSEEGLEQLHRAHVYSIPFENFDILLGKCLNLSTEALFEKLILNPRGGYCFELNGLFLFALLAFGFDACPLMARVHLTGQPTGREHQLSLVNLNNRQWIADVGFGVNGLRAPIPYEMNRVENQNGQAYRLVDHGPFGTMLQVEEDGKWQNLYSFDLGYVCKSDIEQANYYTETNPNSFLTFTRVATMPHETGRISLMDFTLRKISGSNVEVVKLNPGQEYLDALARHFGIRINAPYESLKPVKEN